MGTISSPSAMRSSADSVVDACRGLWSLLVGKYVSILGNAGVGVYFGVRQEYRMGKYR